MWCLMRRWRREHGSSPSASLPGRLVLMPHTRRCCGSGNRLARWELMTRCGTSRCRCSRPRTFARSCRPQSTPTWRARLAPRSTSRAAETKPPTPGPLDRLHVAGWARRPRACRAGDCSLGTSLGEECDGGTPQGSRVDAVRVAGEHLVVERLGIRRNPHQLTCILEVAPRLLDLDRVVRRLGCLVSSDHGSRREVRGDLERSEPRRDALYTAGLREVGMHAV